MKIVNIRVKEKKDHVRVNGSKGMSNSQIDKYLDFILKKYPSTFEKLKNA